MDMNIVKKAYIRNPKEEAIIITSFFSSGKEGVKETSEKEVKIEGKLASGKMLVMDPLLKLRIQCKDKEYDEIFEMGKCSGIEVRYYNVIPDKRGVVNVLLGM